MPAIYVPEGSDTLANTTTDDAQNRPAVTWLEGGLQYVLVWTSNEDVNGFDIRGRVFNADGTPAGLDFLVATGPDSQANAHIAPLAGGGFVVVWGDSTVGTAGIWGRVYDAALTGAAPILLKAGLPTNVYEASVSGFATGGGFVVSWTDDSGTDTNVHAQVFDSLGLASGPEVTANTNLAGGQFNSAVAALSNANGDYVVVWQDGNGAEAPEIRMAIYTQAGVLVPGSDQLVNTTTFDTQEVPTVTALAGGGFVVAWVDYSLTGGDASGSDIRAQIFDGAGAMVGSELLVNGTAPGPQTEARIAALADGGFVISWTSANGTDDDIRAQRFDASGTKLGAEILVPSDPDGNQAESAVSVSPANGDLVVTWTDYGPTAGLTPGDIEQRLFDLHSFPSVDLNGAGTGGIDYSTAYAEGGAAAAVAAAALEITQDSEHPILTITITITDAIAGDQLTLAGGLPAGITSSAPGGTTLTLTNSGASADDLEQALLLVRYSTTSDNPTVGAGNADRTISILANDGPLSSDTAVTTVAITATNDPATIGGTDTGSVTEDATLTATGTLTVLDPDAGESSFQPVTGAAGTYGSLDLDSAGNWTYTLNNGAANVQALGAGAQPADTITVHSFDNTAHNIVVTVNGTNDAPVANDDTLAATEDVPVTYAAADLTTNDTDVDLDSLSVASVSNATGGTAVRNGDGTVTFTPAANFNGTAGFDYVVSDGNGGTDTGHATVNVAAVNDAPVVTFAATAMGGETRVNSFVANPQNDSAVAVLTGGGHVVVWASIQDGSGYGVHAQRYDSSGAPLGSETLVNTETVANQFQPDVAALADGSYVVVWAGNGPGDPVGIFMQRYNASGVAQGGETLVNSFGGGHEHLPSVTALAGGGYVVVWESDVQDGSGAGIFGQRFDASGVAQGAQFPVNTVTGGVQQYPSVTGLADGGFAATWFSDHEGSGQGVYVRRFDALGVGQGNEVRANTFTANDQSYSSIGALADGGYVVAWASLDQDGSHYSVYAQRYSAAGAPVGVEFRVNTTLPNQQEVPTIAGLADGGFVITWRSFAQDGSDYGVYAQRYNAAGATVGVETLINTTTSGSQLNPDVAALPGNGYVVAWHGNGAGDSDGVFTQLQSTAFFATEQVALSLKGRIAVSDVDAGAGSVTVTLSVGFGVLHVDEGGSGASVASGNDSGSVTITGTIAQINALLGSDATSVVTFTANSDTPPATTTLTLSVNDNGNSGGAALTDSDSATINIAAVNDPAVLSADARNLTETNLAADISSSGTLTISDVDSPATFVAQGGTVGSYGTFAINAAGAWTYTASSAHNEFAAGVTYTDTFSVSSADGTTTSVTINILGTNDAAVLSADVRNLTETNLAADISSSGTLTISDVDSPATFVAQGGTAGTYGTFAIDGAGAWIYTASSAHNEFVAGVTYTDTFPVSSADGTLTSVTINILGTNDAAILSADTRNLTETNLAADISSSGTLTISDVDSPATFVAQGGTIGTHGTFAINTAGAWTYTASSAHDEFAAGVTYTDTFSVASADGTLTSVTINILGTNDAPEGVDHSLTFNEDVPHVFTAADFAYSDAENDDFFSVTITTLPAVGTGIIYYDADGAGVTFAPVAISAGQAFTAADLADGRLTYVPPTNVNGVGSASFTYQVRDDAGTDNGGADFDTSANTITIDLTAVNDAPTVAIAPPGTTDEHIALSLKGAISVGDVDSASDTIQVAVSVGYGILTADPTGSGAIVSGSGTSAITITGTLAQVQAFLGSGGPSTLTYTPHTDNPPASTTLTVTVDDGGYNGTGGPLTATANQSINIVQINDAPSGFDHPITASENTPRALNPVDFAFTDPEGHGFAAVTIVTLPTQGTLMYDADGPGGPGAPVAVTAGTTFTAAQLVGAKLVYRADPDESGAGYATFTYIVRDNGGTSNGGLDTDPGANTITINVNAFNNGPTVTDLDNDSPTFFEDTLAGVVWLDEGQDAVISDLDSADFNGGSLTVRIVVNKVVTEDELVLITGTNGVTMTGNVVFVDGISIGTYSGGGLGEDLVFTLNAGATPASITRLIHNLSYLNTDTVEPNTAQRLIEFRLLDGDGGSMSAYTTINVVSVDDPATAGADDATTDEATAVTIAVLTNDDDIDGPPPSVAAVNGNPISVGTPITLPSGALLTLNADGTFTYDPNHAFDTTPIAGSGASNTPESDEFTYTLAVAGGTGTVSVTITGLDTNDFLFGTANADTLSGGVGNDFYFVEQALDAVNETAGQGFDVVWTTVSYILAAGTDVEVLSARFWEGMDPLNLTGNEIANTLYGNAGANALDGGGGNDTLFGFGGNDALTGGAGVDVMYGGSGDDFYFVDDAADVVIEAAGQGHDVVWASASYILATGTDVEALSARFWESTDALSLTGNGLANTIYGNAGANALDGSGGNDTLFGFAGNDQLTGGAGVDLMYGGAGDDFYYVDNAGDVAAETAGQGHDAVWTSVNYTLGAGTEIEILSARFWEGTDALALTGNELANAVYGNAGANALDGGGGNDTLFGLDGNDSLTGGTGADTMYGGAGDDFYFVDNALDRPIENAGQGYDVVWTLVSYILAGGTQIEALSAASWEGTSALSLTGNELANVIYGNAGANLLDGADGNDTLFGREGNDALFGGGGADLIYGGAGADSMHGGAGADVMVGGAGDDFYFVENALDSAAEAAGEGHDVVWASVSYTLAADTEIEALSTISWEATTAINLTGNGLDNTLYGNAGANILGGGGGNDTLFGLGGNDTLIGGAGADSFLFNTALGAGNIDTIVDFSALDDTILLDHLIFLGLGIGPIEEGAFTIGTGANDDDDRIIYDPTTGALYYDADGGEGGAAVQFATLQGAPAITFDDFTVI